jgi:hypothetical protein
MGPEGFSKGKRASLAMSLTRSGSLGTVRIFGGRRAHGCAALRC